MSMKCERGDFRNKVLLGDSGYPNRAYLETLRTCAKQLLNESQIIVEKLLPCGNDNFLFISGTIAQI